MSRDLALQGDTLGNSKHGNGRLVCVNGDVYTGQWRYDKRDGRGHAVFERVENAQKDQEQPKPLCYDGEWEDDMTSG